MTKKVLLTGATGFLGSHIYNHLKSQFQIHTLGRSASNNTICDISESIPKITTHYQYVIHSAGKAHTIPKTRKEKEAFKKVNFIGVKNICKSLKTNIPNNFIFISTIAVYGKEKGTNITENTPLNGTTPYAVSKIKAEAYLQEWAKKNKVNLVILRLPLVAGKNPKGNLATMINGIKKGYYFNLKKSKALKSIVLAEDVAKLIPQLENKTGIYNLAGEKDYSFKEIAAIIAKQLNNKKVMELPYILVKFVAYFGDVFSIFPINSRTLEKITNPLTVSAKKAITELQWKPSNLEEKFKL